MPSPCEYEWLFLPQLDQRSGLMASCSRCWLRLLSTRRHSGPEFRKPATNATALVIKASGQDALPVLGAPSRFRQP